MENIDSTRFVVLTGHLDEQPLPDLIRRLRMLKKSGRLQIEYADAPGAFFFEEGQLVDAQLGSLRGIEALYSALELGGASFNFNPLVRPPERSIDRQSQQFIRDLIEAPRREGLAEVRVMGAELDARQTSSPPLPQGAQLQLPPAAELMAPLEMRLTAVEEAIHTTSNRFSRERLVYAVVIGFLAGLSIVTTLGIIYGPFRSKPATVAGSAVAGPGAVSDKSATTGPHASSDATKGKEQDGASVVDERGEASPASNANQSAKAATDEQALVPSTAAVISTRKAGDAPAVRGTYIVQVLVEVKDGRVTDARVWNPRPGAGAYESVALKMARERRYPESFNGSERLRIIVKP